MSVINNIQKAKAPLDKLKESAKAMNEWVEKINKLEEEGKDLSKLQEVFKGVKVFGKLSSSFAAASMGLDVALFFFGEEAPDPNAEVLKAIDKLDGKIDKLDKKVGGLWVDMDVQFTKLKEHLDANTSKSLLEPLLNNFSGLHEEVIIYKRTKSHESVGNLVSDIYEPARISRDFNSIKNVLTSDDTTINPLKSAYTATNGDARTIIQLGKSFLGLCTFAPLAYTLTAALRYGKDPINNPVVSAKDAEDHFQDNIEAISNEVNKYIEKCQTEVKENINNDLIKNWGINLPKDFQKASEFLCNQFSKKYYWLDCAVAVGDGNMREGEDFILIGKKWNRSIIWQGSNSSASFTVFLCWQLKSKPTYHSYMKNHLKLYQSFTGELTSFFSESDPNVNDFYYGRMGLRRCNEWVTSYKSIFENDDYYLNGIKDYDVAAIISKPLTQINWGQSWSNPERIIISRTFDGTIQAAVKEGVITTKLNISDIDPKKAIVSHISRCHFLAFK